VTPPLDFLPEVAEALTCCEGISAQQARANGELLVVYGDLWAEFLTEQRCTWSEPCSVDDGG